MLDSSVLADIVRHCWWTQNTAKERLATTQSCRLLCYYQFIEL